MKKLVYLDNAATTPVDPRVVSRMVPYLYERFGNAAARSHGYGWAAEESVELAREEVAGLLGCLPSEVIWTSGATEANNLAILGIARHALRESKSGRPHLISVKTEHASVLSILHALEREGCAVTLLDVNPDGLIDLQCLASALRPETILVSVMYVNNEIGVIQDIPAIAALCHQHGVMLHVDAAQAVGKISIDLSHSPVDLMSISAHKIHGPQGIGALLVRQAVMSRIEPQILGGGQERGLRSGTLPLHQIVGLGEAFRLARRSMLAENDRIRWLRDRLWAGLAQLDGVFLNGRFDQRIPHNLNAGFEGVDGQVLLDALADDVAVSSGSACASTHTEPSHVLLAIGRTPVQARASIRFSLGRFTTADDVDMAVACVAEALARLRSQILPADKNSREWTSEDEDCPMKRMRRRRHQLRSIS